MIALLKLYGQYILIVLLVIALILSIRSCRNQRDMVTLERNGKDSAYHYATKVELKGGQDAFRIKTLEATVHELRGSDILSELEKIKLKQHVGSLNRVVAYWKGSVRATDTITATLRDTVYLDRAGTKVPSKAFKWQSKYLSLDGLMGLETVKIDYHYNVDFTLTAYRKSQGLFKRSQLVTDITFSDPAVQVGSFTGVVVKEPRPLRFSIGPSVQYDPFSNRVTVGVSAQWSLIRF